MRRKHLVLGGDYGPFFRFKAMNQIGWDQNPMNLPPITSISHILQQIDLGKIFLIIERREIMQKCVNEIVEFCKIHNGLQTFG